MKILGLSIAIMAFAFKPIIAQNVVKGRVLDAADQQALPFVNITYNGSSAGTLGDLDGYFELKSKEPIRSIQLSYLGYVKKEIKLLPDMNLNNLVIKLDRDNVLLMEAVILPGENPAHRIIRQASLQKDANDPLSLSDFSYKSYNKLLMTVNGDSIKLYDKDGKFDSSAFSFQKFTQRSHFFLMESVTERKYLKGKRDHEEVLASRISGFENPMFTLIGTQFQSFSFYQAELEVLGNRFINPLRANSMREYFFVIQDTLQTAELETDTVYAISFRPRDTKRRDLLEGTLFIGTDGFSLRNVIARKTDSVGLKVEVHQKYAQYGKVWFPVQLLLDIDFGSTLQINGLAPKAIGRTYIQDIAINAGLDKKGIPRVELSLGAEAAKREQDYWNRFRNAPLDAKEQQTYGTIDSIGQDINLDQKVAAISALINGKFRWKWVDFELDRLLRFNEPYEGLRLGLGLHTNERLSKYISTGGYFAYGFKDKAWKYGADVSFRSSLYSPWKLTSFINSDIAEMSQSQWALQRKPGLLAAQDNRYYAIDRFDEVEQFGLKLDVDLRPNIKSRFGVWREDRRYLPQNKVEIPAAGKSSFQGMIYQFSLAYAPGDKYMNTPEGRRLLRSTYPIAYLDVIHAQADNNSANAFQRLQLRIEHSWKSLRWGDWRVQMRSEALLNRAPVSYFFSPLTNLRQAQFDYVPRFDIGSRDAFETMLNNEFLSDRQLQLALEYAAPKHLIKIKKWNPQLAAVHRFAIGDLQQTAWEQGPQFQEVLPQFNTLEKGFWESGVEMWNLYRGLGLGFYYRYGPYAYSDALENLAIKFTSTFTF